MPPALTLLCGGRGHRTALLPQMTHASRSLLAPLILLFSQWRVDSTGLGRSCWLLTSQKSCEEDLSSFDDQGETEVLQGKRVGLPCFQLGALFSAPQCLTSQVGGHSQRLGGLLDGL